MMTHVCLPYEFVDLTPVYLLYNISRIDVSHLDPDSIG